MREFNIFFHIISFFVKLYKWWEHAVFKLFSNHVEFHIRDAYAPLDVKFSGPGVSNKYVSPNQNHNEQVQCINNNTQNVKSKNLAKLKDKNKSKKNSWDIVIHNPRFFSRVANHASLGMGESYMDGWWDSDDLVELSYRIMKSGIYNDYLNPWNRFLNYIELSFFNLQSPERAWEVGKKHYDMGNDLFESFLDPRMNYSCGYWGNDAQNLEEAQLHKMELIARKMKLKPGMTVLDIGCGWGGLCQYLAERHHVHCVGITVSKEGVKYAEAKAKETNLPINYRLMDYRDLDEKFDRVVSVGMFEHVGRNNHRTFFEVAHRCLVDDGLLLLHTIGNNAADIPGTEPFFHTYVFPNGYMPYYQDITQFSEGLYVMEDWHNFGHDYSRTLTAWRDNFVRNWPKISHKYGDRFYRMWMYYLQTSAGGFRARKIQLWQVVFSKTGIEGGYRREC